MVAGFHLIWTAYGWWLPNDPRGSWSDEIRVEQIADLGELHYGRKDNQLLPQELRDFYAKASVVLKHALLTFGEREIDIIGKAFARIMSDRKYTCYACAIMPDHVHLLIRKHRDHAETMIKCLQDASRAALIENGCRQEAHPVWGGPGWKVFLYSQQDIERTVTYVQNNPMKAGRSPQSWGFVKPYDGWMPGYWQAAKR